MEGHFTQGSGERIYTYFSTKVKLFHEKSKSWPNLPPILTCLIFTRYFDYKERSWLDSRGNIKKHKNKTANEFAVVDREFSLENFWFDWQIWKIEIEKLVKTLIILNKLEIEEKTRENAENKQTFVLKERWKLELREKLVQTLKINKLLIWPKIECNKNFSNHLSNFKGFTTYHSDLS